MFYDAGSPVIFFLCLFITKFFLRSEKSVPQNVI